MHIRWTKHPQKPELNGTTEHADADIAKAALTFGFAELVKPALEPKGVRWSVYTDEATGKTGLIGTCNRGCGKFVYTGDAQFLLDNPDRHKFQHGGCSTGAPTAIPASAILEYADRRALVKPFPRGVHEVETLEDAEKVSDRAAKRLDSARLDARIKAEQKAAGRI